MDRPGPPPAISNSPLLEYVVVDSSPMVRPSSLFVDGVELGPVPGLAICGPEPSGEVFLIHCDESWSALGISAFGSTATAKARAEAIYPGIADHWVPSPFSSADVAAYLAKVWEGTACSFCGRVARDYESLIVGPSGAAICNLCVAAFREDLPS